MSIICNMTEKQMNNISFTYIYIYTHIIYIYIYVYIYVYIYICNLEQFPGKKRRSNISSFLYNPSRLQIIKAVNIFRRNLFRNCVT